MSNPFIKLVKPLRKPRYKTIRKIGKKTYKLWSPPGSKPFIPCRLARKEAERLRKLGYSVRVQKRKNNTCSILIRKKVKGK